MGKALAAAGIPYMIIGGQAVLPYGEPRLTRGIDITLGLGVDRWRQIVNLAGRLHLDLLTKTPAVFVQETYVLPAVEPKSGVRIDFIFSHTAYERRAIKRANRVKIEDGRIRFAAVEDIIVHKIVAGRARDIDDVKNIVVKNPRFDCRYVKRWLRKFESLSDQKNLVASFKRILQDRKP